MDAIDAELAITATETCEEILALLPTFQSLPARYFRALALMPLAAQLGEKQKRLEDAVAAYSRPLVSGRLDEPGPIATSLIALVSQLSRMSLLLHGLAHTTTDRMAAALREELDNVRHATEAVAEAMTPHNFAGIHAFVDNEWLGNALVKEAAV
ncbi:hypothetical protein ACWEIJ_43950 [Lentzea sp. NPDC004789]